MILRRIFFFVSVQNISVVIAKPSQLDTNLIPLWFLMYFTDIYNNHKLREAQST